YAPGQRPEDARGRPAPRFFGHGPASPHGNDRLMPALRGAAVLASYRCFQLWRGAGGRPARAGDGENPPAPSPGPPPPPPPRALLGAGAQLQVAEVVDARGAEVPLDPAAGAVVVAEEGERRLGGADDRADVLAAAIGKDGVPRRLVHQQHVKAGAAQRRRAA